MFVDGRTLNGARITADVCIVGAGAAGISLALDLRGQGLSVVLLESGDLEPDDATQSLYEGENASFVNFNLESTRLRYFGGTTNHWGGFTYPFGAFDFAPRPYVPVPGWPISWQELAAFYPRAGTLCQLGRMDYQDVDGWQRRAGFAPLQLEAGPMRPAAALFSPPTRFGTVYRDTLRRAADVKVLLNSNVRELLCNWSASHVESADVQCIGGARYGVTARTFVVAMGGLETPRLLLLSRQQQAAGLGNGFDLVGRYYMDHCGYMGGELIISPSSPSFGFFLDEHAIDDGRIYGIFTPRPEVLLKQNLGNFRIQLFPIQVPPGIASLKTLEAGLLEPQTLREIGHHLGNILVDIDQVADLAYKNILHSKTGFIGAQASAATGRSSASMHISAEQVPNPLSRMLLSDQTDMFGQHRIKLDWRIQDTDRRTLTQAMSLFAASISAAGYGRVRLPSEFLNGNIDRFIEIACHHMGTTRMSETPSTGVVDTDCKVHGVDNLYIASSSTFPTSGWVNPTLTIVALALRLADHIKSLHG